MLMDTIERSIGADKVERRRASGVPSRRVAGGTAAAALAAAAAVGLFAARSARATDTVTTVASGTSDLAALSTGPTVDLSFNVGGGTYAPSTFTYNTSATVGSLDDTQSGQTLTITNGAATASALTLGGAGTSNNTSSTGAASTGDLLYVGSGATLNISSGTSPLSLALGLSGNFDVAGTATIGSGVSGGFGLTKTGVGTLTFAGTNSYTGTTTVSAGTLTYGSGAAVTGATSLAVGTVSGVSAVLNLSTANSLSFSGGATIGGTAGTGVVNQTAGTVAIAGTVNIGGASGTYTLGGSGSVLNLTNTTNIGGSSYGGVFLQTGGTLNVGSEYYQIGNGSNTTTSPAGVATFSGGTANLETAGNIQLFIGNTGPGVMNIGTEAGGTAMVVVGNATNTGPIEFNVRGATGVLNVNSGTLELVSRPNSTGVYGSSTTTGINLNGGTIQAGATSTLINNVSNVFVYAAGATIDTQGYTSLVSSALQAAVGNGVYPAGGVISAGSADPGGTAIVGIPVVAVSGGSGTGLTAVAVVSGGVVTGFAITSPGQNYLATDTLKFTLTGGGATTGSTYTTTALGSAVAANTGGLTKVGSGTLELSAANTYAGPTNVSAGTLQLGTGGSTGTISATSSVSLASGATLAGDLSVNYAVPAPISGAGGVTQLGSGELQLSGSNTYTGPTNISGGNLAIGSGGATGTLSNTSSISVAAGRALVAYTTGNITVAAPISGAGGVAQQAAGTTTLSGSNSYSGGTNLNFGGTLNATNVSAFGVGGNGSGTLNPITAYGASTVELSTDVPFGSGANPIYDLSIGNATGAAPSLFTLVLNRATAGSTTAITQNLGQLFISKYGGGNVTFDVSAGPNAPSGGATDTVAFTGGTYNNASQNTNGQNTGLIYGNTTVSATETLNPVGANIVINGLVTPVSGQNNQVVNVVEALDLDGSSSGNVIQGSIIDGINGNNVSQGAVFKTGTSKWTLNGINSYSGPTNISGGTLVGNGAAGGDGAFGTPGYGTGNGTTTVSATGILAGTGTLNTVVVASGGKITAGSGATASDSIGNLSSGSQTWNASGGFVAKFAADNSVNDRLIIAGLTVNAAPGTPFTIDVQGTGIGSTTNSYLLAVDTGVSFATTPDPFTVAALSLQVNGAAANPSVYSLAEVPDASGLGGVDLDLVVTAPEPTSLLLAAIAASPLALSRRRRGRSSPV
jgi:fibronectin-binding autotransporter adhesin